MGSRRSSISLLVRAGAGKGCTLSHFNYSVLSSAMGGEDAPGTAGGGGSRRTSPNSSSRSAASGGDRDASRSGEGKQRRRRQRARDRERDRLPRGQRERGERDRLQERDPWSQRGGGRGAGRSEPPSAPAAAPAAAAAGQFAAAYAPAGAAAGGVSPASGGVSAVQAAAAAGLPESVALALSQIVMEATQSLNTATATAQAQMGTLVANYAQECAARCAVIDSDVARMRERQTQLEASNIELRDSVKGLAEALERAEAQVPLFQAARQEMWDRPAAPNLFQIQTESGVTSAEVLGGIEDWLTAGSVASGQFALHSLPSGRHYVLELTGGVVGYERAKRLVGQLRVPGGWRNFSAGGRRVFVNVDKSKRTLRVELHTKRLAQALGEVVGAPDRWWPNKARAEVKFDLEPVASVLVTDEDAPTQLRWNNPMVAKLSIDKSKVQEAFNRIVAGPREVEWCP